MKKIDAVTIAKLNENRSMNVIIDSRKVFEGKKLNVRDTAIAEGFRKFAVGTVKTAGEFINAAKITDDFIGYTDAVTDRELMNVAHQLQAEKIGIISRKTKKGAYVYTRLDWAEFVKYELDSTVVTIDEQKKAKAERAAKKAIDAKKKADENARSVLASAGFSEKEIEVIMSKAERKPVDVSVPELEAKAV